MKKIINVLLSLIIVCTLVPMSAFASDIIDSVVVLNIKAPVDGAEFDRFADIPNGQPYSIFSQPEWYDETDKRFLKIGDCFEAGHIYTVNVWLEAKSGYEFKSTNTTTDVRASINGVAANAGKAYEYQRWAMVVVSYSFPAVEKAKPVGKVEIEISKPKPGETVSYDAKITGEGVKLMSVIPDLNDVYKNAINGIEWDDETANHNMKKGETFTVGHEYGLSVFIEPEAGYKLDATDKDYSVTVNGLNAMPIDGFSDERRGYYISYDCIGDIGDVNFLIVEPEVGSVPFFKGYAENGNVDWEVTELSYFDASTRRHLEADDTFEEGHYYKIYFRMQAKDGYDFSKDANGNFDKSKITINGHAPSKTGYFSKVWKTGYVEGFYGPLKKNAENLPLSVRDDEIVDDVVQSICLYDLDKPKAGAAPDYITVWFSNYYYPVFSSTDVESHGVCWKNITTGKDLPVEGSVFEEGNEYEAHIRVVTNYKMKQDGIEAYLDGAEPDRIIDIKEGEVTLVYNFGVLSKEAEKHDHSYTSIVTTAPTCTSEGYTTYTCSCGDTYISDKVNVLTHKDDNKDYKCDYECGYVFEKPVTPTEPTTAKPVETTKPIATEPTTAPSTTSPVTQVPTVTEPVTQPTTAKPVESTTKPTATEPTTAPSTTSPVTQAPTVTEPATQPTTAKPVEPTTKPVATEPTTVPSTTSPATQAPTVTEPTTQTPTVTEPATKPSEESTTVHTHTEVTIPAVPATYTKSGKTEGKECSSCGEILKEQKKVARKKLKKVTKVKAKKTTSSGVTLSWKKVTGADSYKVYYSTNGKKWKSVKVTKNTATIKKLSSAKNYQFKVRAYAGKYYGEASKVVKATTKFTAASLTKVNSTKKKQTTVAWKQVKSASGYVVEYSTSKNFTKKTTKTVTVKNGKTTKTTLKKLKSGKKYYVRVKAYKTVNKKAIYGEYSKVKTVKVK